MVSTRGMASQRSIGRSPIRRLIFKAVYCPMLRLAGALHVTSSLEKKDLELLSLGVPVVVAPNGVEDLTKLLRPEMKQSKRDKFKVICVGRVCRYKNIDLLVDAFGTARRELKVEMSLTIAGPIEDEGFYRQIVNSEAYTNNARDVVFAGDLNRTQLAVLYEQSDLLVCCSESENFGLSIAEGLKCGVPAVCPNESLRSLLSSDAIICVQPEVQQISEAIVGFGNRWLAGEDLTEQCRSVVEEFSWESQVEILVSTYDLLLGANTEKGQCL